MSLRSDTHELPRVRPAGTLNGNITKNQSGRYTLGTIALRGEQDFVSLRRRTRAAGEEVGLSGTSVRRLSAAAYEAAQLLFGIRRSTEVEIRLVEGPALEVVLRMNVESDDVPARDVLQSRIEPGAAALRPLVDQLSIGTSPSAIELALRKRFQIESGPPFDTLRRNTLALRNGMVARAEHGPTRDQYAVARRALRELEIELQETNRGVIALYAELDDQAERLREAEDRLRLLLDSVRDYAICMLTVTGEVASWNAGAERLFAYTASEIVGRHFSCFYLDAEREAGLPEEHLRIAREEGRFAREGLQARLGGAPFDAHVLLTPVYGPSHELRGYSLVVRNITERKRLEADLRRRAEDLAAANRAKEDFLATLSHELRTPLNAMLGWTRLLRSGRLDPETMERALDTIERNAHMQEQLIADILDLSRIVTGKLRVDLRPVELTPILRAAVDAVSPGAAAKGVHLLADVDVDVVVLGDADRLQQVVWNLLANSIKFTPAGGMVRLSLARTDSGVVVTVTDTGEGIEPALLPFIFDRFTQGDASVTRPHGGLGLGLSIVRHILELHGGKVQASSEGPGKGAIFSLHLPLYS